MKESESDIQSSICEYLGARRHFFWRQNTAPTFDRVQGIYRAMPKYAMRGVPDIIVIRRGQFVGIECKTSTGKLSAYQATFAAECRRHGGDYIVARSIDDVQRAGL